MKEGRERTMGGWNWRTGEETRILGFMSGDWETTK